MIMSYEEFIQYCCDFYCKDGIYEEVDLTRDEIETAVKIRMWADTVDLCFKVPFEADSIDREMIRDIALVAKGKDPLGYTPDGEWKKIDKEKEEKLT